jgi:hypothetical protein
MTMESYDLIQSEFIRQMREIMPDILNWWRTNAEDRLSSFELREPRNAFEARWPFGPVSHPRVIHLVRKYFIETNLLNRRNEILRPPDRHEVRESDWGSDDEDQDVEFQLPIDLLVHDLEEVAPDVFSIVSNLVFIPVGLSPDEEYC